MFGNPTRMSKLCLVFFENPIKSGLWDWSQRTSIMGILNVTLDSFSDGGKFVSVEVVVTQARLMISEGADMINIGANSTRPMASRISAEEELDRLMPVLEVVAIYCTSWCFGWSKYYTSKLHKKIILFYLFFLYPNHGERKQRILFFIGYVRERK